MSFLLTTPLASCVVLRGPRVEPFAFYDARGNLALCTGGELRVENADTGKFEALVDREWQVVEAVALPDGDGFVVRARRDASVRRGLWFAEPSTDLWLLRRSTGEWVRLTHDENHEFDLEVSPDGRSVVFAAEHVREGGALMAPTQRWSSLALDQGAAPFDVSGLPPPDRRPRAPQRYAGTRPFGLTTEGPAESCANPCLPRAYATSLARSEPLLALDSRDGEASLRKDLDTPGVTYVDWIPAGGADQVSIRVRDLVAVNLSPDGSRMVVVERRDFTFPYLLVVEFVSEHAVAREYSPDGKLLREFDL